MYVCVRVRVCVRKTFMRKRVKKEKREKKKREKKKKTINLFIQTNTQTDRRTDGQIDKSFIAMRHYTEKYSKSNSIE